MALQCALKVTLRLLWLSVLTELIKSFFVSSLASFQCQKNKEKGKAKESLPFAPFFHTVPRPNEHMFPFQCFEGLRFASNPKHEGAHLPDFCLFFSGSLSLFRFPSRFRHTHTQTQGYCHNVHRKPHLRHGSMNTSIGSASFGPRYDIHTHYNTQTLVFFFLQESIIYARTTHTSIHAPSSFNRYASASICSLQQSWRSVSGPLGCRTFRKQESLHAQKYVLRACFLHPNREKALIYCDAYAQSMVDRHWMLALSRTQRETTGSPEYFSTHACYRRRASPASNIDDELYKKTTHYSEEQPC